MLHGNHSRNNNENKRKRIEVSRRVAEQNERNKQGRNQVDPLSNREDADTTTNVDGGHRFGNFHEYYKFHPVDHRLPILEPLLRYMMINHATALSLDTDKQEESSDISVPTIFRYLDVGCNEGDLTLAIAERLTRRMHKTAAKPTADAAHVHVLGIDLDPVLIDRARAKVEALLGQRYALEHLRIQPSAMSFETVNVLQDGIPRYQADDDGYIADLTSLFSTTMWLHIHGGDDGLRRVLQQICDSTRRWILLEVQPSKCYGKAALRWRKKMGGDHPPLDVSTTRLRLRARIDEAVEEMLQQFGFERVQNFTEERSKNFGKKDLAEGRESSITTVDKRKEIELKTPWNRSCRLYRRVESLNKST